MTLPSDLNNVNSAPPTAESARGTLLPKPMIPHPAPTAFIPPALATMPDAASLLKALRRRLVPALILGLIFAAVAGTATWFLLPPPKIAARTQLYIALTPPKIMFAENNHVANDMFRNSQAYLSHDHFLLRAALREPGIAELSLIAEQADPIAWLEKELKVEFPSPEVMHISLSGDRPEEQKKIVSAVTKIYLENYVNKESKSQTDREKVIKDVLSRYESLTKRKREELRALQKANGGLTEEGMATLQKLEMDDLRMVSNELTKTKQEVRRLQVELDIRPDWVTQDWPRYAAALNALPGPGLPINHVLVTLLHDDALVAMASSAAVPMRELEAVIDQDENIAQLKKQILMEQDLMERTRKAVRPEKLEEKLRPIRGRLAGLEKRMEALRDELRPVLLERFRRNMRMEGKDGRSRMQIQYRIFQAMERKLFDEVTRLDNQIKQNKQQAVDLIQLKDEIEQNEKFIKDANNNLLRLDVEKEAPQRISQPDKEAIIFRPDETKRRVMITSGAAIGALALVLLAFAWFEFQSRKVHSTEEVVHGLGLNLVGTVPDASPRSWLPWSWNGGNAVYTQSMLTESVDAARMQLLHVARQENLQIVMITSALAGEGKTSLASHLAASLARSGRRTILVDSDLRNPTLHRLFERSRAPGLSELLRGEADLATVSRDTPIPGLWLISAGKADTVALQGLAFDTIPKLFEQLRSHYDFVIVDSCPVLPVADSLLVGQHVDAVIFSLLRQVSRLPRVYSAYQRLSLLGIRMLGAVVNGTSHDLYPADYNYVASENE